MTRDVPVLPVTGTSLVSEWFLVVVMFDVDVRRQDMEELVGKLQLSFDVFARAMNAAMTGRADAALPDFVQHLLLLQTYIRHPWRDLASCQSAVKQCYRLSANTRQK